MTKHRLFISTVCLLISTSLAAAVGATTITTELCDNTAGPVLLIDTPLSDSIVNTAELHLQGTALRTTQIDIALNGAYSSSLAIGPSGQIDTTLTLFTGTNTIRLQAYYSCNQATSIKSIVVTYEPTATPSSGATTTTIVLPTPSLAPLSNGGLAAPAEPPRSGSASDPTPSPAPPDIAEKPQFFAENYSDWGMSLAPVVAALATPTLVLWATQQLHGTVGAASRQLSAAHQRSIRASGLLVAALLAALLFGVLGHA